MKTLPKNVDIIIPYKTTFYFSDYMKITHTHTQREKTVDSAHWFTKSEPIGITYYNIGPTLSLQSLVTMT